MNQFVFHLIIFKLKVRLYSIKQCFFLYKVVKRDKIIQCNNLRKEISQLISIIIVFSKCTHVIFQIKNLKQEILGWYNFSLDRRTKEASVKTNFFL